MWTRSWQDTPSCRKQSSTSCRTGLRAASSSLKLLILFRGQERLEGGAPDPPRQAVGPHLEACLSRSEGVACWPFPRYTHPTPENAADRAALAPPACGAAGAWPPGGRGLGCAAHFSKMRPAAEPGP
eukprot:scaffold3734_cov425-Prasinococcus_capsulatus_cf.AAC.17